MDKRILVVASAALLLSVGVSANAASTRPHSSREAEARRGLDDLTLRTRVEDGIAPAAAGRAARGRGADEGINHDVNDDRGGARAGGRGRGADDGAKSGRPRQSGRGWRPG